MEIIRSCDESFLVSIGFKKAHIMKLKRAFAKLTDSSVHLATDPSGRTSPIVVEDAAASIELLTFLDRLNLGVFWKPLHEHGSIDTISQVAACSDDVLVDVGFKKAHIAKFRESLKRQPIIDEPVPFFAEETPVSAPEPDGIKMYQKSLSGNLQELLVPGPGVSQEGSYRSLDGFYGSLEECFTHETSEGWCFGGACF
jgi:hypothetical protein